MPTARLRALLAIRHPILQGGMSWVSKSRLAAAVSEAGGLGVLGAATMEPAELREEMRAVRARTTRPFGVNIPLVVVRPDGRDPVDALCDVALEERAPIVITGAGSPERLTRRLKDGGALVLHVVPTPRLAKKAADAGVDAIIAESFESGGHVRSGGLATFSLVPQVVDAVDLPVVAAGGIADGRGMAAALALGAEGVQLGTRFVATVECEAHAAYKEAVVAAGEEDAPVYCARYHASRGLLTPVVRRLIELEQQGAPVAELLAVRGRDRARKGCVEGDIAEGLLPAGAAVGLVRDVRPVAAVIEELVAGCAAALAALGEGRDERRSAA